MCMCVRETEREIEQKTDKKTDIVSFFLQQHYEKESSTMLIDR